MNITSKKPHLTLVKKFHSEALFPTENSFYKKAETVLLFLFVFCVTCIRTGIQTRCHSDISPQKITSVCTKSRLRRCENFLMYVTGAYLYMHISAHIEAHFRTCLCASSYVRMYDCVYTDAHFRTCLCADLRVRTYDCTRADAQNHIVEGGIDSRPFASFSNHKDYTLKPIAFSSTSLDVVWKRIFFNPPNAAN